ncbi:hypothetical protein GCM10007103_33440 [Salinimicrobium marinum]|uniref:DUF2520 domain-containing protein n=1 Tax=Salinimicrobium marinum TaxID=680283 RepID=A0A918W284_9FLAO|nr:Rossmann-like and DUF2520 domain-containing protein [Salinimicrobium marinum]GHA49946.1 hypothetical protein GCM10007103_33440 [Salinimicrobium marinum]
MINVVLLGTGNVATHLFQAFSTSEEVVVIQVYNHSEASLLPFSEKTAVTTSLQELKEADIYLMALKDDIIVEIANKLQERNGLVVHTSGAVPLNALEKCRRSGIFYPLQTFSKDQPVDYSEIPFCLEAKIPDDLELLKDLASGISRNYYEVDSSQRKKLHLAAVFVCNFVNHLYTIGEDICRNNELPFEILQPLIKETAEKITRSSPKEVQTGPAKRGDNSTINAHLELIASPSDKDIYQLLTKAIKTSHGKKL